MKAIDISKMLTNLCVSLSYRETARLQLITANRWYSIFKESSFLNKISKHSKMPINESGGLYHVTTRNCLDRGFEFLRKDLKIVNIEIATS